jgi:hyaluronate lyase
VITIALVGVVDTPPYSSFASRESTNRPELIVGTSAPGTAVQVVADAYARGGSYASTNFGSAAELVCKSSETNLVYAREAFLKLDISGVQPGDTVRLRLYGRLSDTRSSSVTTQIHPVADPSWSEGSLTWNDKPAASGAPVATVAVSGTSAKWYEVDLTDHVQAQRAAGANLIAIALKNPDDTPPYASFSSRESANGPQLAIVD